MLERSGSSNWPYRSEEHTSELQSLRHLHSFPTRRSSDLRGRYETPNRISPPFGKNSAEFAPKASRSAACRTRRRCRTRPSESLGYRPPAAPEDCACSSDRDLRTGRTDRKSTRLNSSHLGISTLSLHDALPICVAATKLRIEFPHRLERIARSLRRRHRDRLRAAPAAVAAPGRRNHWDIAHRPHRRIAHARAIGIFELAVQIGRAHV